MINELKQYFLKRLKETGLTEATNKRSVAYEGRPQSVPVFYPYEKDDALHIPYVQPDGESEYYQDGKKIINYERIRYRIPKEYTDKNGKRKTMRYSQPRGTGVYSYLPPLIVDKFQKKEKIKTLYVVEGEFKAITATYKLGIDIIALGGINNYQQKEFNILEPYLLQIIDVCKPDNIVLLFDADCLAVKYQEKTDLASRLTQFYNAVSGFRELLMTKEVNVYFSHILSKYAISAKGLDDLINLEGLNPDDIRKELENLGTGIGEYFSTQPLRPGYADKLNKYFKLHSYAEFYEAYKDIIQDKEFKYNGRSYYFDGTKVISSVMQEAKQYLRIGCDFYKKVWKINPHKDPQHQKPVMLLEKWQIGEINRDFNNNKNFISYIPKYDAFINYPDNTDKYRRIIEVTHEGITSRFYNRYNELKHEMYPGDFSNIESLLKHIFSSKNTKGESLYEFGLDWIQITFFNPRRRLPVLCPVSTERNTGKTKFLEFLRLIFKDNSAILDNERFTGKFTAHFVDKLIVALDEGFIPMEQKLMKERIKNFSTGSTVWSEGKGKESYELDNFMHLIMCSNDESNFMQIDEGENRFCVLKVPTLKSDNPNIINDCEKELPCFLYFLSNRKLKYETEQSRFSFHPSVYETEALKTVMERTEKRLTKEIKEFLRSQFIAHEQRVLHFAPVDLAQEMNEQGGRFKVDKSDINDYLRYEVKKQPERKMWYKIYHSVPEINPNNDIIEVSKVKKQKNGTPYEFRIEEYFSQDELKAMEADNKLPDEKNTENLKIPF